MNENNREFKEKLNLFFRELRKKGYFAKQKFSCCRTCGWSEIPDNYEKAVFYTTQDADNLSRNYVYLNWSGDGNEICEIAKNVGLNTEWDGDEKVRVKLSPGGN